MIAPWQQQERVGEFEDVSRGMNNVILHNMYNLYNLYNYCVTDEYRWTVG